MYEQQTLFEADEATSTRRVLVDDEIYCPDCLVVAEQMDDVPDCPECLGPVFTAGAVIDEEELMEEMAERTIKHVVTEVYCPACEVSAAGDAAPADGRCPVCGSKDVEESGYVVDEQGRAVV